MNVINCTPHEVNLLTEEANIAYPPSGIVTRVNATSVMMPSVLPMVRTIFGDITGLPEPMDHTYFIVSGMVLSALFVSAMLLMKMSIINIFLLMGVINLLLTPFLKRMAGVSDAQ